MIQKTYYILGLFLLSSSVAFAQDSKVLDSEFFSIYDLTFHIISLSISVLFALLVLQMFGKLKGYLKKSWIFLFVAGIFSFLHETASLLIALGIFKYPIVQSILDFSFVFFLLIFVLTFRYLLGEIIVEKSLKSGLDTEKF